MPENQPTEVILQHESGANLPFAVPVNPGQSVDEVLAEWARSGHVLVRTADASDPIAADPATEYPGASASKTEWVEFAVAHGAVEADVEALHRNEIRDMYLPAEPASE